MPYQEHLMLLLSTRQHEHYSNQTMLTSEENNHMRSQNPVNGIVATIILFGVALIIASCAVMAAAPAIPEITIRSSDYSFEAPTEVLAGLVTILHENAGHETHHVQILQLKDGVTTDQVIAALAQSEDAIFALLKGFPAVLAPQRPATNSASRSS